MKSKFKIHKLGEFITEVSVRNNKKQVGEVFSVTNSEGFIKSTDYFDKEVFSKNISNYKVVSKNQFAYNPSRINVGSISFLKEDYEVAISPLYVVFQCNKNLTPDYLLRFLKSPFGINQIRNKTRGAVRDILSFGSLSEIEIPIPNSIQEQSKIVSILELAESLIEKRRKTILELERLKSFAFYALFGNPIHNTKGFPTDKLEKYISSGPQNGLYLPSTEYGQGVKILRIDSFNNGEIIQTENLKRVRITTKGIEKYSLVENDLVINRVNSRKLLGKVGLTPSLNEPILFESNIMRFSLKEKLLRPYFVLNLFKTSLIYSQIQKAAKDAVNQSSINQADVKNLNIIVPPIQLQRQFDLIVKTISTQNDKLIRSEVLFQKLYSSLSYKGYNGDLSLDDIEVASVISEGEDKTIVNQNIENFNNKTLKKKGSVIATVINSHFKNKAFNYQDLAEKVQASLVESEYDYNKIKNEVFNSLKGNSDIQLKQIFNEKDKTILLQRVK